MEIVPGDDNVTSKKNLSFQVDHILEKELQETAWRKRVTLSKLLREYCQDGLFREVIRVNNDLKF